MARYFKLLTTACWLAGALALVTACQEGRDAGDLLGQWRLTDKEGMYVSFSGSIAQFRKDNGTFVFAKFQHTGDSLFLQCSSIHQQQSDTILIENEYGMSPFTDIRLRVDALDDDHLTLSKDGRRWLLEKY